MEVAKLTGAIVNEAELSDGWIWWGFCSGLEGVDKERENGKDSRPSAPSSTGCFQGRGEEGREDERGLLTRSQSELRAFSRG